MPLLTTCRSAADFDVDEYIKSFHKPQTPADPEVVQAGELLKSAKEKEGEGDMDGAKKDLDEAISTLRSTIDAKKLLSAGYFARGRHWAKRQKVPMHSTGRRL